MVKILGVKIVQSVRSDVWCSDVVGFNTGCRWRVDGVLHGRCNML